MESFVSKDGTDDKGVRAEVQVYTGTGTVKEIKIGSNPEFADVHFNVEHLKHAVHGWMAVKNPLYAQVEKAYAEKETIQFRIEAQRKAGKDRTIPIDDLRKDMNTARDSVKVLLVGVGSTNDKAVTLSDEAVTLIEEDPAISKGRIRATAADMASSKPSTGISGLTKSEILERLHDLHTLQAFDSNVLGVIAAQALLQGATPDEILEQTVGIDRINSSTQPPLNNGNFSVEAPQWNTYNRDGRLNLGGLPVAAAVGAESFVRGQLAKLIGNAPVGDEKFESAVEYFASFILTISDKVQVQSYDGRFKANRAATSHTKARGIVYDTIEKHFPLPISEKLIVSGTDEIQEWVKSVGRMAVSRYKLAARIISNPKPPELADFYDSLIPDVLMLEPKKTKTPEPVADKPVPAPKVEKPIADKPIVSTPTVVEVPVAELSPVEDVVNEVVKPELDIMPFTPLDESLLVDGVLVANAPTDEDIELFKSMIAEFNVAKKDLNKVSRLLANTFGEKFNNARLIPVENLMDFIDTYTASGDENFLAVLENIK